MENIDKILRSYGSANEDISAWINNYKEDQKRSFKGMSFPTRRDEDWKYTSVAALGKLDFKLPKAPGTVNSELLNEVIVKDFSNLVFVDGVYSEKLSNINQTSGLVVVPLKEGKLKHETEIRKVLEKNATFNKEYFASLNESILEDGVFISVSKGQAIDDKINIIYIGSEAQTSNASFPCNIIYLEESSQVTVMENYAGSTGSYFTNASTNVYLEKNATLKLFKVQTESMDAIHISETWATLSRDSHFETFNFSFGSKIARNNLEITMAGEGANAILDGLYVTRSGQHVDNHTTVDHKAAHCESSQYYKGILDGKSRAVFNGRVLVQEDAQKTNAFQLNKNLLLSTEAEIDTKPQLEIDADDVKCAHGATVGQLNDDEIFYLETRGLNKELAEAMLSHAYAEEIIIKVSDKEVRDVINKRLSPKIKGN